MVVDSEVLTCEFGLQVNFLTSIVGLKPGAQLHKKLANVMGGLEEGADLEIDEKATGHSHGVARAKVRTLVVFFHLWCMLGGGSV